MKLSTRGVDLIASFEGFRARPYLDSAGTWTIGYGSTKGVGPNTPPMTRTQALARMMREVDERYAAAIRALDLPLNQNQFDALTSFVYNVGPGGVAASTTVGRRLRARDWAAAADALLAWNKAGGRVLPGLTRRRHAERALFLEPARQSLKGYTPHERALITEYDRLLREKRDIDRRRQLRAAMTLARKRVWAAAQPRPRGDGRGWNHGHRSERYRSLLARSR